jgi:hypothetical protein
MDIQRTERPARRVGRNRRASFDRRAGFALPAAIFALAVVAILITAGFHMANQEHRVGVSSERATQAFYTAEQGLGELLANWSPARADSGDWKLGTPDTIPLPRGFATLRVMRLDERLFYIQSVGEVDEGGALANGARRALGMTVRQNSAEFPIEGALTTQGDVELRGSSEIHGEDHVPSGWNHCPPAGPSKPGVVVGDTSTVTVQGSNEEERLTGDPPWRADEDITDDTFTQFGDMDWDQLTSQADIVIPADGSSGGTYEINNTAASLDGDGACDRYSRATGTGDMWNWGYPYERDNPSATYAPCHNYFPVVHVRGNARIQSNGYAQGILLVDGDVDLRGDFNYFGVIIAQGQLETQGGNNPRIVGGAIARNADLDLSAYVGSSVIQYSSCAVNEAIQNAQGLNWVLPLQRRNWVDLSGAGF